MAQVRRRQFLTAAAALLAAPRIARAQAQKRLPVLGILSIGNPPSPEDIAKSPFLNRLRELGWIEGKTFSIERAYTGDNSRLPELAASLVAKKVDVIWTSRTPVTVAAARATKSIPIVFMMAGYPVELGLVNSLARPGRNVTGVSHAVDERVLLKRLQLLRDLAPDARRLASLAPPATNLPTVAAGVFDLNTRLREQVNPVVRNLGFEHRGFELASVADVEPILAAIAKWKPNALAVYDFTQTALAAKRIVEFARSHQLADGYESLQWVQAGGLFSYGNVILPLLLRTVDMVDRILRGAKPAELPVELPSHYEMTVNLATAKSLDLKVPQSILLRADKVIE